MLVQQASSKNAQSQPRLLSGNSKNTASAPYLQQESQQQHSYLIAKNQLELNRKQTSAADGAKQG